MCFVTVKLMPLTSGWISKLRVKSVSVWIIYGFSDSLDLFFF
jgi:hypothetical protein